jgi:integrase
MQDSFRLCALQNRRHQMRLMVARGKRRRCVTRSQNQQKGRTVALSATIAQALHDHRIEQAEQLLQLGIRTTGETHICTNEDGSPLRPNTLTLYWKRLVKKLGLPVVRFHDLRHARATHMLTLRVHPKVASERLGHSDVRITMDLYSHVLPGIQEDAVALVDTELQAEIARKRSGRNSVEK